MKLKLLPLAIGAVMAMPTVAMAETKIYGKVNVTLENYDDDDSDHWRVQSNASRLGFKGKEKINDNLSAVYKMEYQTAVDDGSDVFKQRNIYGGLEGGFGQVIVGKFDSPLKKIQNKVDVFSDYAVGDVKNLLGGEDRLSNLIQYTTPKSLPVKAKLAIQPGENEDCPGDDCKDGLADGISASVAFDQDGIYAGLAHNKDIKGWDTTRLVGQFNMDMFQVGLLFQTGEESDGEDEEEGFILSGAVKVGPMGKVKLQYGASEYTEGGADDSTDKTQIGVGYDHKLSKQTMLLAHYIMLEEETGDDSDEESVFAVGMQHKF